MTCRGCENEIDDAAAFCPLCGADPLLGDPWPTTLGLPAEQPMPRLPEADELEQWSDEELAVPALWYAYAIQAAESLGVEVYARESRMTWLGRRLRARQLRRRMDEAHELAASATCAFRAVGLEIMDRCRAAGMSPEDFIDRYPRLGWACFGEFVCYGHAVTAAELHDTFTRRIYLRIARLGGDLPRSWAPEDAAYRVAYNGLLLTPFPGDGAARMPGMENVLSGPDCLEGTLQVTLTPAAWRCWDDELLAPAAMVLVFEQANPLGEFAWDADGPSESLLDAARGQAARIEARHGVPVTWDTLRVTGLPAASCDFSLMWEEELLVQRYVWVYSPEHVYFLEGLAPAAAPEYVEAVRAAIAGFEVAA